VTAEIEQIYDRNIAAAALRSSDKYERLAAVVFFLLTEQTTVHNLRLRGDSGVKHQIDVVIGPEHRRLLIECKDYDKNVGLPQVRNFFAVVEDVTPDEAFMVTTRGYSTQAITYAEAKGIRLALLRSPEEEDLAGLVRRVQISVDATAPAGDPLISWQVTEDEWAELADVRGHLGSTDVDAMTLTLPDGSVTGFRDLWEPIEGAIPLGSGGLVEGEHKFGGKAQLCLPGYGEMPVTGFLWKVEMHTFRAFDVEVGLGIGGLVAELALHSLDGEIRRIFTNHQMAEFDFDGTGRLRRV